MSKVLKSNLWIILAIFTSLSIQSQPLLSLKKTFYLPCTQFQCDPFGNIYTFSNSIFTKYDTAGIEVISYNENKNGAIGNIDISNPLKILVYFPERSKVIYLDRNFSPIENEIDLISLFNESFSYCCTSYSNGLWAYSQSGITLIRINQQAVITTKVESLNQIMFDNFKISQLIEDGDYLYVGNPHYGIVIFDRWGAIIKQIPLKYENSFQAFNNQLFYFRNDTCFSYNPLNFEETTLLSNRKNVKQIFTTKSNLYIQTKSDTIYRYQVD